MKIVSALRIFFEKNEYPLQGSLLYPPLKVAVAGGVRYAVVMRKISPSASRGQDIQNAVHHILEVCAWSAGCLLADTKMRGEHLKLADG